ncbi:MAG: UpxY family transcription antiterminator [Candidatus Dadabacteria bacterium]|nr:UpxY family transcription antiterminator [Candidatus Dadabacteria bacterium]
MDNLSSLSNSIDKEWYAVYTASRHEKAANAALCEKGKETFLPLREVISQWKDRKKEIQVPLFPGYLFTNIHLQDRWSVLNTPGIVRILGINGTPVPVPAQQIEAIRELLSSKLKYDPYPYFCEGKEVMVVNGPLQGTRGRILEKRGACRLILSIDFIQRAVSVEVDIRVVELV